MVTRIREMMGQERGASAVMVAGALVFLMGAAALAVDVSGFYNSARTDQTTADLACLAGVAELPDQANARQLAATYVQQNWPDMVGASYSNLSGTTSSLTSGANSVIFETNYGGDDQRMRLVVTDDDPATFARVIGSTSVSIVQEAVCEVRRATQGAGPMPLGALPGTFSGDLFDCADKVTGNCGALGVDASGASEMRDAVANGVDSGMSKHHGSNGSLDSDTGIPVTGCPAGLCNASDTKTGNNVGPFNQGVADRLSQIGNADCVQGGDFNCDSLAQVLGGSAQTLQAAFGSSVASLPADFPSPTFMVQGWQSSLYGPYTAAMNQQYWVNGPGIKCDSPRLSAVPIVVYNNNWDLGDAGTSWPNGTKTMKVIGFYSIYIREPDNRGDVGNGFGNNLNQIVSDVVWFGPDATCEDGSAYAPVGSFSFSSGVKLVAP